MSFLIALVARAGIPERFQKVAAWIAAILAAIALLGALYGGWRLWLGHHVKQAIDAHDAASDAAIANQTLGADRAAAANMQARDDDFDNSQAQLKETTDAAAGNDGDALDALFGGMRNTTP